MKISKLFNLLVVFALLVLLGGCSSDSDDDSLAMVMAANAINEASSRYDATGYWDFKMYVDVSVDGAPNGQSSELDIVVELLQDGPECQMMINHGVDVPGSSVFLLNVDGNNYYYSGSFSDEEGDTYHYISFEVDAEKTTSGYYKATLAGYWETVVVTGEHYVVYEYRFTGFQR